MFNATKSSEPLKFCFYLPKNSPKNNLYKKWNELTQTYGLWGFTKPNKKDKKLIEIHKRIKEKRIKFIDDIQEKKKTIDKYNNNIKSVKTQLIEINEKPSDINQNNLHEKNKELKDQ